MLLGRPGDPAPRSPPQLLVLREPLPPISSPLSSRPRVALVHDYLVHYRGGERVFHLLGEIWPEADRFTLVYDPSGFPPSFTQRPIRSSFMQHLPGATSSRTFRAFLPLYPLAAASLDLRDYDLVVSNSSAWAHWAKTSPAATHVCNCLSPFRYAWSHYDELIGRSAVRAAVLGPLMQQVRRLDRQASRRVDRYVAISEVTRQRIERYYGRESTIILPPVDLDRFSVSRQVDNYFLVVSALVPYKRVDIVVEAFTRLGLPLRVVGDGPERGALQAMAGPTVQLLGSLGDREIAELYSRCRALIFPSYEDYGIVPLEAMASGRPVLAYGAGGALETVRDGVTGRFFAEQTADAVAEGVRALDPDNFDPAEIRRHAERFGVPAFKAQFRATVEDAMAAKAGRVAPAALAASGAVR
jgi:glycosyltransferase involved in cell wall biosynthesis